LLIHPTRVSRDLHSFPTRRSSDLERAALDQLAAERGRTVALDEIGAERERAAGALLDALGQAFGCGRLGQDGGQERAGKVDPARDRESTRLNSSHRPNSYAVFSF